MEYLGAEFNFDSAERHIRCGPHTINLAVQSMMYGSSTEAIDDAFRDENEDGNDGRELEQEAIYEAELEPTNATITAEVLRRHRKSGPMGKLHNIGVCFNYSSQLMEAFNEAQGRPFDPPSRSSG